LTWAEHPAPKNIPVPLFLNTNVPRPNGSSNLPPAGQRSPKSLFSAVILVVPKISKVDVLLPQYVSHVHARVPRGRWDDRGSATDCRAQVARRGPSSLDIATGVPSAVGQPCEFVDNRAVLQGADAKCQS
jgi:hypothetical protein